jgi:bifunctional DNA-binding transcriptional regulator/antitoxin component of YhaV-PrlF toxin-antitoxin module
MIYPSQIPPTIPDSEKIVFGIKTGDKIEKYYMTKEEIKIFLLISGLTVIYGAERLC